MKVDSRESLHSCTQQVILEGINYTRELPSSAEDPVAGSLEPNDNSAPISQPTRGRRYN